MNQPPVDGTSASKVVQVVGVGVVIALYAFDFEVAATRALGGLTAFYGMTLFYEGRVPYGWEGREPSGYITGWPLKVFASTLVLLGLAIAARPRTFLDFFA